MPACNEYGVAGTTKIEPPPAPKARSPQGEKPRGQSLARGDVSPEEPGSSDDESDEATPLGVPCGRGGPGAPSGAATNPPGDELPEKHVSPSSPSLQESDQVSEAIPPPLADMEVGEESLSLPDLFDDLVQKRWSFSGSKRARR